MGTYVYAMKPKTKVVQGKEIALCSYAYKPYSFGFVGWDYDSFMKKVENMENRKQRYGNLAAQKLNDRGVRAFAVGDKFEIGCAVYEAKEDRSLNGLYYDDFEVGSIKKVGYLTKVGRKWVIVDEFPQEDYNEFKRKQKLV